MTNDPSQYDNASKNAGETDNTSTAEASSDATSSGISSDILGSYRRRTVLGTIAAVGLIGAGGVGNVAAQDENGDEMAHVEGVGEVNKERHVPRWTDELTEEEERLFPIKHYDRLPGATLPEGIVLEQDVEVEMSDGLRLAANVFRPDKEGEFPVTLAFTPFSKDYDDRRRPLGQHSDHAATEHTPFEGPDPGFWVPHDYVVAIFDERGLGRSPSGGTGGAYDYHDAVEWAGTQEWSNGNVGLGPGHSAIADFQWEVAGMEDPPSHLEAMIPWGGFLWERGASRPGGIPEAEFIPTFGENLPLWQEDEEFEEREPLPAFGREPSVIENITVPTLLGSVWADSAHHLRGNLYAWRTISTSLEDKWLYLYDDLKWKGQYTPAEAREMRRMFFDHYLKGIDSGIKDIPSVRLEVSDKLLDSFVRYEEDWPIPRTDYTRLYLDARDESLHEDAPDTESSVTYDSEGEDDHAVFEITFDEDTELSGHSYLKIWVSPEDKGDMDIFVTLRKLDEDGHEVRFRADTAPGRWPVDLGFLRLSKRELDDERSEPWLPVQRDVSEGEPEDKVEPGEVVPANIQIVGSSTYFHEGETLRLEISGTFGIEDDLVFGYEPLNEGDHSIYTGSDRASYLHVPMIPDRPAPPGRPPDRPPEGIGGNRMMGG